MTLEENDAGRRRGDDRGRDNAKRESIGENAKVDARYCKGCMESCIGGDLAEERNP